MLRISRDGRVLRLELNRPEKRNALNGDLCRELAAAIEEGDRDTGSARFCYRAPVSPSARAWTWMKCSHRRRPDWPKCMSTCSPSAAG
jgi:Enoyl-CoA hydratase/carnithine racemase